MLGQRAAGVGAPDLERVRRQKPERSLRADVGIGKPSALLGADAHHRNILRRHETGALPRCHDGHAGDYTGSTVEIAALRHRVEMRGNQKRPGAGVAALQRQVEVSGDIAGYVEPRLAADRRHQVMSELLAITVRRAGDAGTVARPGIKRFEQFARQAEIRLGDSGGGGRVHFARHVTRAACRDRYGSTFAPRRR